jgi:hypothetical protein
MAGNLARRRPLAGRGSAEERFVRRQAVTEGIDRSSPLIVSGTGWDL